LIEAGLGSVGAMSASTIARRARAYGYDGELGHPVPAPPSLDFVTMSFDKTPLLGRPSTAIVGVPKDIPPGTKLPLAVLLPGGHSNWQPHDAGCWCWWSEYGLGDCEWALRNAPLDEHDFQELVRPEELQRFNAWLQKTPYRGVIVAAAWCLTRDLVLDRNGAMNSAWLRQLVDRIRGELPVIPTRDATGLGGMSSGGLWAMYCGAQCEDLFGHVISTEPYTRELVDVLHRSITGRKTDQTLRIVSANEDRIRPVTMELVEKLRADRVAFEYVEYLGKHDQRFAAGPGGIDMLFAFDRALRGEHDDGSPLVPHVPAIVGGSVSAGRVPEGEERVGPRWMRGWDARTGALLAGTLGGTLATAAVVRRAVKEDADDLDAMEPLEPMPASSRRS
jgi:hypothetical protein